MRKDLSHVNLVGTKKVKPVDSRDGDDFVLMMVGIVLKLHRLFPRWIHIMTITSQGLLPAHRTGIMHPGYRI